MTDISELIERLGALSAPDRAVDWEIHLRDGPDGVGMYGAHPPYTASIDSAMMLVPEGWCWGIFSESMFDKPTAWCWPTPSRDILAGIKGDAPTPAIALTLAALKARAGEQ